MAHEEEMERVHTKEREAADQDQARRSEVEAALQRERDEAARVLLEKQTLALREREKLIRIAKEKETLAARCAEEEKVRLLRERERLAQVAEEQVRQAQVDAARRLQEEAAKLKKKLKIKW
jgi:hypothetical protein